MKSTEPIVAIVLTKEDKAQFDDEVQSMTNSEDPQDVNSYKGIPILVREYSALMIEHKVPELIQI